MNLAIEEPSKVIKMRMGGARLHKQARYGEKTLRSERRNYPSYEQRLPEGGLQKALSDSCDDENCPDGAMFNTKEVSIDFFDLNSAERKQQMEFKDDYDEAKEGLHLYGHDISKGVLERSFIEGMLENDIRVKDIKYGGDLIFIYFFTVEDSISFYKQFLPYVEIHFSEAYDFEQAVLLSSSEWASITLSSMYNSSKDNDACDQSSSGLLENGSHLESRKYVTCEYMEDESAVCFHGTDTESNEWHGELSERILFEKKIEHFTHLRNFFSRSEVKAMMQSLEVGNIDFVFKNTKELAVGNQSNKVMQEAIGLLPDVGIARIIQNLGYDIAPIAANKHGAYTVQMLISVSKTSLTQNLLSKYFRKFGGFLITHEIGNYTIQKILRFDPNLIFELFISNIKDVVGSELGIKVLKRCLEFFPDKKAALAQKAREHGRNLNVLLL
ncbi:hypothetical protein EHEL_070450 [Encephalitozoon hellem ATCC 50504]|uniref:PUM-HD domain-containing protein n=1 Tax=Encephalitozoon hellem TaxID=27973 RepID=A0A9Q9C3L0_ENCHE|nr:uncharacterized protein EHEL_070450 [Encephalitozoon hellem ATCC 50504]AFM98572.1 hypothetical protein EHEL_070450 [Encephalitozoon hellem ATCC 50504]UTX43516.1 hypothetical protein GPU96_07g12750 [Encephalitozoon hellem]WEL38990.1 hypothetical protein PFJ87_07g00670 [Encephalitozoon hellem]|eukprot:XP_003887553.1 hypothetical protein EHEL_070450 [Encephalitozoon hellem ATCC 50504]